MAAVPATQSSNREDSVPVNIPRVEVTHTSPYFQRPVVETKMNGNDRVISLRPMEGKTVRDVSGMTDPRSFTGENKLHALFDENTQLWYLKYDSGALPNPLKQRWTNFTILLKDVKMYFAKRNIVAEEY